MAVATLRFITDNAIRGVVNVINTPKRVRITQNGGSAITVTLPYGPHALAFDKLGVEYKELRRPTLKPLLIAETPQLRTVSFNALLADRESGGKISVQDELDDLATIASEDVDCGFTYGLVALPYQVRITKLSYSAIRRDLDGNIIQADVSIQLTETLAVDQVVTQLTAITFTPTPQVVTSTARTPSTTPTPPEPINQGCELDAFSRACEASAWAAGDAPIPKFWAQIPE